MALKGVRKRRAAPGVAIVIPPVFPPTGTNPCRIEHALFMLQVTEQALGRRWAGIWVPTEAHWRTDRRGGVGVARAFHRGRMAA